MLSLVLCAVSKTPAERSFSLRFSGLSTALRSALPGTALASEPFECGGEDWRVSLYPRGSDFRRAGRVGAYLRLDRPGETEVDVSFSISLAAPGLLPSGRESEAWDWKTSECATGGVFRCGMTFTPAAEAVESVGRACDWGAHLASSAELAAAGVDNLDVELTMRVWRVARCKRGAGVAAVVLQATAPASRRRPLRLGEVLVPLPPNAGDSPLPAGVYPGVEYRVIAIRGGDGEPKFSLALDTGTEVRGGDGEPKFSLALDTSIEARGGDGEPKFSLALDTSTEARGGDRGPAFDLALDGSAEIGAAVAAARASARGQSGGGRSAMLDGATGAFARRGRRGGAGGEDRDIDGEIDGEIDRGIGGNMDCEILLRPTVGWRGLAESQRHVWPVAVSRRSLPPLASRFDLWRATPARLQQAVRADAAGILIALLLGLSPLLLGGLGSMYGSLYLIPSRSMEPTLVTGDLLLAQKRGFAHAIGRQGLARGQLVLFTPPPELRQRVEAAGGRMGDRDMFVKRVAAVAGDEVTVDAMGFVTVNGLPATVNGLPVTVNGLPATVNGLPVTVNGLPVTVNGPPVTVNEPPVTVNGLPAGGAPADGPAGLGRNGPSAGSPSPALATECDAPNEVVRKQLVVPAATRIPEGSIFVLGDCSGASVDSRVWGPLDELNVVGTPIARLWPASRFGGVR